MDFEKIKKKIIIGSWSWSDQYKKIKRSEIENVITLCLDYGIMEFDTSPTYGKAELILSELKKKNKRVLINTKCGWDLNLKKNFNGKGFIEGIERSLDIFGKINILQLHNPRNEINNWNKIFNLLNHYKNKNYIKMIGISLARNFYFSKRILSRFDFIQDEFNLLRVDAIYKLKNYKNLIAARSPFANGILTKKFNTNIAFHKNDHRKIWLKGKRLKNIYMQKKIISNFIKGKNIEKFSLDFILSHQTFNKIIIGIRTCNHFHELIENLKNFKKIDNNIINKIININKTNYFFSKSLFRYNN